MTEWEPATEAEVAMRDALRAGDQEEYFRILTRSELLLPVSADTLAGRAPMGWGTWTTSGRTHVLAFTSGLALQACLAENAGSARQMTFQELAASWPNLEWWLAVNPGLPIEGYLPAWFVTQLARGDVRLPGRARIERAETASRARATAAVPGRMAPPGAVQISPASVSPAPAASMMSSPVAAPPAPAQAAPTSPAHGGPTSPAQAPPAQTPPPPGPPAGGAPPGPPGPEPLPRRVAGASPGIPVSASGFSPDAAASSSSGAAPSGFSSGAPDRAAPDHAALDRAASAGAAAAGFPAGAAGGGGGAGGGGVATGPEEAAAKPAGPPANGNAAVPTGWGPPPAVPGHPASPTGAQPAPAAQAPSGPAPARPDQAPDPAVIDFTPANDVEKNLIAAAGGGSTDAFLSTLLLAKVLLPVSPVSADGTRPGDPGFAWLTETIDNEPYVVVFTSMERLRDHLGESIETIDVKFMQLIKAWPDPAWSFAVNPSTPVGAKLPGPQILALASWAAEVGLGAEAESPAENGAAARPAKATAGQDPSQPTIMQKTIAPNQVDYYLERGYDRVSGFVHRANEVAHLTTPAKLHAALGLGYAGSPFRRDADEVYVLRWPAYRPSLYRIPYGGQNEPAMRAMEGWVIERPPFRGNGFAPSDSGDVIAEFKVDSAHLPHSAQLWRIRSDGTEKLIALLDADAPTWRRVGEES